MKIPWFHSNTKRQLPQFWLDYTYHFQKLTKLPLAETSFVVFDTETTGLAIKKDRILSIGAVRVLNNQIEVQDSFEVYVKQDIFNPDTVKIHGILQNSALEKVTEEEAVSAFLGYIKNAILVGHHVGFDVAMINQILERHQLPKLKNKLIDTAILYQKTKHEIYVQTVQPYTLDELSDELQIPKSDRHTASGDALITAMVFLKTLSRLQKKKPLEIKDLLS